MYVCYTIFHVNSLRSSYPIWNISILNRPDIVVVILIELEGDDIFTGFVSKISKQLRFTRSMKFTKHNSKQQCPSWQADSRLGIRHTISDILWDPKIHCRVYNKLRIDRILIQFNSVHILTTYTFMINFVISIPSSHRFSKWTLSFRFSS
jgi:hypothetical protein